MIQITLPMPVLPTIDLMTIFQERKWQEEPDIIAMNGQGDLYIFELKRIQSNEDNILQLLRYAQNMGLMNRQKLTKCINHIKMIINLIY